MGWSGGPDRRRNRTRKSIKGQSKSESESELGGGGWGGVSELDLGSPCTSANLTLGFPSISGNKLPLLVEKQILVGFLSLASETHNLHPGDKKT